jgi:alanyl-tRNA synthetase
LLDENKRLEDMLEKLKREKVAMLHKSLLAKLEEKDGYRLLITHIDADAATIKDLAFELKAEVANAVLLFAYVNEGKPGLSLLIGDEIQKSKGWNAGQLVRDLAKDIQGGGGGQPGFATAGGSKPEGIEAALQKAKALFS